MNGEKAIQYLASRIGQLEADKAVLLAQMEELSQIVFELKKEVETHANSKTDHNE